MGKSMAHSDPAAGGELLPLHPPEHRRERPVHRLPLMSQTFNRLNGG